MFKTGDRVIDARTGHKYVVTHIYGPFNLINGNIVQAADGYIDVHGEGGRNYKQVLAKHFVLDQPN